MLNAPTADTNRLRRLILIQRKALLDGSA